MRTRAIVATELGVLAVYAFSKELSLGTGVGVLFAGDPPQSNGAGIVRAPYGMWNVRSW